MTTIEEIEKLKRIDESDLNNIVRIVFNSIQITTNHPNPVTINKIELIIGSFSMFLEKYLDMQLVNSNQDRLMLMKFIDKLNMQKELLDLEMGKTNLSDIEIAGKRLGKKAQSAFGHD